MKFKCTLKNGRTRYRDISVINGDKYLCVKDYIDLFVSPTSVFESGEWYEMKSNDKLSATFITEHGSYFLKTYVDDCLFDHFDFSKSHHEKIMRDRKETVNSILPLPLSEG